MDYCQAINNITTIKAIQFDENLINVKRTVKDIEKDTNKVYFTSYSTSGTKLKALFPFVEVLKYDIDVSNSNNSINIKMLNSLDGKCLIEVFTNESLLYRLDVSEVHDKVIGDDWFGGCSFSPNGKYFTYVAG